ncbi:MAG: 4Fe-4S dicluster domain-containing protein [Faecalimonas umbilicata]
MHRLRLLYAMSGGSRYSGKFQNLERSGSIPEYRTDEEKWSGMDEKAKADHCIRCGKCEKVCPQKISIRENLQQVAEELNTL